MPMWATVSLIFGFLVALAIAIATTPLGNIVWGAVDDTARFITPNWS